MLMTKAALAAALLILAAPAEAGMQVSCLSGIDANEALRTFVENLGAPTISMVLPEKVGPGTPAVLLAKPSGEWVLITMMRGMACVGLAGTGMKIAGPGFRFPAEVEN